LAKKACVVFEENALKTFVLPVRRRPGRPPNDVSLNHGFAIQASKRRTDFMPPGGADFAGHDLTTAPRNIGFRAPLACEGSTARRSKGASTSVLATGKMVTVAEKRSACTIRAGRGFPRPYMSQKEPVQAEQAYIQLSQNQYYGKKKGDVSLPIPDRKVYAGGSDS
jgi:hypothetical protein